MKLHFISWWIYLYLFRIYFQTQPKNIYFSLKFKMFDLRQNSKRPTLLTQREYRSSRRGTKACLVSAWQAGYRPGSDIPPQAAKSDGLGSCLAQAAVARVQTKNDAAVARIDPMQTIIIRLPTNSKTIIHGTNEHSWMTQPVANNERGTSAMNDATSNEWCNQHVAGHAAVSMGGCGDLSAAVQIQCCLFL
jgi:hypothetical protein